MLNWLINFQIEKISFFIGFFSALIIIFVFQKLKQYFPHLKKFLIESRYRFQKKRLSNVKNSLLQDTFHRAHSNHLTKELFPLDDLVIQPNFLIDPGILQDESAIFQSEISSTVPFIPDFPVLSRNFNISKLKIDDLCKSDANFVIYGMPGSGKTVAISLFVSFLIRNLQNKNLNVKTPLYFSAYEIPENFQFNSTMDLIITLFTQRNLNISYKDLSEFIKNEIELNTCILIMDDLDELHPEQFNKIAKLLEDISREKPNLQIITTCSPLYVGNIVKNGFNPLFLTSWSNSQIMDFYNKWDLLWKTSGDNPDQKLSEDALIKSWTSNNLSPMTPLEHTLYIWGAYSGDLSGNDIHSLIDSYLHKVANYDKQKQNIKSLAFDSLNKRSLKISSEIKSEEIEPLVQNGLIKKLTNNLYVFSNSQVFSYLAYLGNEYKLHPDDIDLSWPATLAFYGFTTIYPEQFSNTKKPLEDIPTNLHSIHQVSYVLKHSPTNSKFQNELIKSLINKIQNRNLLFQIRLRAMAGLIQSNNPNLLVFIKQLLSRNEVDYSQLALFAIGCATKDSSILLDVIKTTTSSTFDIKKVGYLILTTFSEEQAIHELGKAFLNENEKIRQLIAESFAIENSQGEEILKDAITMEDIVVRRAAISGLTKLNNDWARKTLQKIAIEDEQWVIRNAAIQAIEYMQNDHLVIPNRLIPIHQNPWLIKFAGIHNLGVSHEKTNIKSLLLALSSEDLKDIKNAIHLSLFDHNEDLIEKMISLTKTSREEYLVDKIITTLLLIFTSDDEIFVSS